MTPDEDGAIIVALLNLHATSHNQVSTSSAPKLQRPSVDIGIEQETWNAFVIRWNAFRTGSSIPPGLEATQLFQCASEALGDLILKSDPQIQSRSTQDVLNVMQSFAVIPVARGVLRAELMQLQQEPNEPFRTFAAKVTGKAETCGFTSSSTCECGKSVEHNYTVAMVRDVLLAGIADVDIRREALCSEFIQEKGVNDVIAFVEAREMARNATPSSALNALSSFKRSTSKAQQQSIVKSGSATAPCPDCGKTFKLYTQRKNGSGVNKKPHERCLECWRKCNPSRSSNQRSMPSITEEVGASFIASDADDLCSHISVVQSDEVELPKAIFSKKTMRKNKKFNDHPRVPFTVQMLKPLQSSPVNVNGIADTGAQSNLWGLRDYEAAGFHRSNLQPVRLSMRAANQNPINVIGAFNAKIEGRSPTGDAIFCFTTVFVSDSVTGFYLCYDTMVDLLI